MIVLKPFSEEDFDTLISWIDSEEALVQFAGLNFLFPLTREQLALNLTNTKIHAYKAVQLPQNRLIGYGEIYITDMNEASLGKIIIGDESLRGQGFGLELVNHLVAISFNKLGAGIALLNVFTKKRQVNGKVWTAVQMVLEKEKWEETV